MSTIQGLRTRVNWFDKLIGFTSPGVASVHAAVQDTATGVTISTSMLPINIPGRLTATVSSATTGDIAAVSVIVTGTDPNDLEISETLPAFSANAAGTKTGVKVFKSVTSYVQPKHDATSPSVSVGLDGSPAVADTDGIMSALTDTATDVDVSTGVNINFPDVPRNITATVAATTTGGIAAVAVVLTGKDSKGLVITETLDDFTVNTAGIVTGSKMFAELTNIFIPKHDTTSPNTAIGFGDVLGIDERLERDTVLDTYLDNTKITTSPTVSVNASDLESNSINLNTVLSSVPVRFQYMETPQT